MPLSITHLVSSIYRLCQNSKFVKFLCDNQFLTQEAYQEIAKKLEVKHNELIQEERNKSCTHLTQENSSSATSNTSGC
jgi:hypothetical protein